MPCTCSEPHRQPRRARTTPTERRTRSAAARWLAAAALTPTAACTFTPAPAFPRPALTLPAAVSDRFAPTAPPQLLRLDPAPGNAWAGELACGAETIHFHLVRSEAPDRPLVLLVPILAGGDDLMRTLARHFVDRGYQAAWCDRVGAALRPPQRGADLERLFQRTVVHQRALLAWLRACSEVHPSDYFACGVSMGGMVTAALTAVEPSLCGAAICLAGADVPAILADSRERRVVEWRAWRRREDGLAGSPLAQELGAALQSDPLHLSAFVPTNRVFLVATQFDDVVRPPHQQLLWEALGRPERLTVPLGHYSAALVLDAIVAAIDRFFGERSARSRGRLPS